MNPWLACLLGYVGVGVVAVAQSLVRDLLRGDLRARDVGVERTALWVGAVLLWPFLVVGEISEICLARRADRDKTDR